MATKLTHADIVRQASDYLAWACDPVLWAADQIGFNCDDWQARFLRSSARQIVCVTSRQSGKSTITALLAAHTAIYQPRSLVLITSPTQRQAGELLRKCHSILTAPKLGVRLAADAVTSLELQNGSRVLSLPANPDAVRGMSSPAIVIEDEAAWCPDELHLALRPMLAASPRGRFILLSTPGLRSGHFHSAAHSTEWEVFKVTADQCPRISPAWLEAERREHDEAYIRREYFCEWCDGEYSFFGSDLIEAAFNCNEMPLRVRLFT